MYIFFSLIFWKRLFSGRLPENKSLFSGSLLENRSLFSGCLPENKSLFSGRLLVNMGLLVVGKCVCLGHHMSAAKLVKLYCFASPRCLAIDLAPLPLLPATLLGIAVETLLLALLPSIDTLWACAPAPPRRPLPCPSCLGVHGPDLAVLAAMSMMAWLWSVTQRVAVDRMDKGPVSMRGRVGRGQGERAGGVLGLQAGSPPPPCAVSNCDTCDTLKGPQICDTSDVLSKTGLSQLAKRTYH